MMGCGTRNQVPDNAGHTVPCGGWLRTTAITQLTPSCGSLSLSSTSGGNHSTYHQPKEGSKFKLRSTASPEWVSLLQHHRVKKSNYPKSGTVYTLSHHDGGCDLSHGPTARLSSSPGCNPMIQAWAPPSRWLTLAPSTLCR